MNSSIANRTLSDGNENKNHQAFFEELSRLEKAKEFCLLKKDCNEFNRLGGEERLIQLEPIVRVPQKTDKSRREVQKDTNPNNTFHKDPSSTKPSELDDKSTEPALLTKAQLSEGTIREIQKIKYLMIYMDDNNNNKINN